MSAPRIYLDRFPSFCQKLSKLVEIWRSSEKKTNLLSFLGARCILLLYTYPIGLRQYLLDFLIESYLFRYDREMAFIGN